MDCTCNHGDHTIVLCPLHAAAPRLFQALERLTAWSELNTPYNHAVTNEARAAIRAATGAQP